MNYDNGIDLNFDRHCDLCGKFVDSYGHHKISVIYDNFNELSNMSFIDIDNAFAQYGPFEFCNRYFIENPYRNSSHYYGSRFWLYIKHYTSVEMTDPFSGLSINSFLRNNVIPSQADNNSLVERVIQMNIAIDDFEVKSRFIAYRGFEIDKNSDLVKMFDEAFDNLQNGKTKKYIDKGFVSTTLSYEYAKSRCNSPDNNVKVKMAIVIGEKQKCMPLSRKFGTTYNDFEKEILLKSNQEFEIISVQRYKKDNKLYYNLGIILREDAKNDY